MAVVATVSTGLSEREQLLTRRVSSHGNDTLGLHVTLPRIQRPTANRYLDGGHVCPEEAAHGLLRERESVYICSTEERLPILLVMTRSIDRLSCCCASPFVYCRLFAYSLFSRFK